MTLRIGSLFSGYEGLGMGVQAAIGGDLAWVSDIDPGACKVLAHRYPDVPNLGDITAVDWATVGPVDVLTGGFPCQDVSIAGKRAGISPGTRSGLWTHFAYAISQVRPTLVVIENVRGLLSAEAHRDVEPEPEAVGDGTGQPVLRALGAVLGDLADLGYDAAWCGLRAADVGAPHGRFRVFIIAWPADTQEQPWSVQHGDGGAAADTGSQHGNERWVSGPGEAEGGGSLRQPAGRSRALLPTPRAGDGAKGGPNQRGSSGDLMLPSAVHLLPTPMTNDSKSNSPGDQRRKTPSLRTVPHLIPTPLNADAGPRGGTTGFGLRDWSRSLLPTPRTVDVSHVHTSNRARERYSSGDSMADVIDADQWGHYAAAVARWEGVTRPSPPPTELSAKGTPRLSARFSEWLMGPPAGWITDVPGITRNEALKLAGNGVVPQQATEALRRLLPLLPPATLHTLGLVT